MSSWNPVNWFRWKTWRNNDELLKGWNKQTEDELLTEIHQLVEEEQINILFIGVVSSGKSSTINSYFSIFQKRLSNRAPSGNIGASYTMEYKQIRGIGQFRNIVFYDTKGIDETKRVALEDVEKITKGEIMPTYKFDANDKSTDEKTRNELEAHCVVYVIDAEHVKNGFKESIKKQLKDVAENIKSGPRVIFLTKVDCACSYVDKDITCIYSSTTIKQLVEKVSEIFGVPSGHTYPIKNYVEEQNVDPKLNIPLLIALKRTVGFAHDFRVGEKEDNFTCRNENTTTKQTNDQIQQADNET